MTKRILHLIWLVAICVFFASSALFTAVLYDHLSDLQREQLRVQTALAAQGVSTSGLDYLQDLPLTDSRVTWIAADGSVLFDNQSDPDDMENHLAREEVQEAFSIGFGESDRYSDTQSGRALYCAQRLPDGTVLRLSISHDAMRSLLALLTGIAGPTCLIFAVVLLPSLALASGLSKKIVRPLNALDLDEPLKNTEYDELSPLLRRIDAQQRQIRWQTDELRKKQQEFETVTSGMAEGIILLNSRGIILSINPAAMQLLETDDSCIGQDILSVNRQLELQDMLLKSAYGKHSEQVLELGDNSYQIDASPVISGGQVSGTVLLLLDVTEKATSEQMRREFTANVSHELKTPLHTISGCAELMANGLVQPADIPQFANRIYTEAQRMIHLVEDILKLSHLDEGASGQMREPIDLYQLTKETLDLLSLEAKDADISLRLSGEATVVQGIRQLLQGIVYNLCDNAIKYNRKGGSVNVSVRDEGQFVRLTVADTGIGIPPEHQERIFERFYRVDKSHSKEIGGTGLGLSIVKHAARLHSASIALQSTVGRGTTITVTFPKTPNP
jgi:two-component system phosphate regulon sensor histidine kinase PhoR